MDASFLATCGIEKSPDGMEWMFSLISAFSSSSSTDQSHSQMKKIDGGEADSSISRDKQATELSELDIKEQAKKKKHRRKVRRAEDTAIAKSISWGHIEEV